MDSVSCDLQTGSDFPQLASTCSDGKIRAQIASCIPGSRKTHLYRNILGSGEFAKSKSLLDIKYSTFLKRAKLKNTQHII